MDTNISVRRVIFGIMIGTFLLATFMIGVL